MILDYSEHDSQYGAYGINSPQDNNRELFYSKRGWCPFCHKKIPKVYNKAVSHFKWMKDVWVEEVEKVWECSNCGWWEYTYYNYMEDQNNRQEYKDWELKVKSAMLRKYETNSKNIPIDALRSYISKNNDMIYKINDKKMEELVASIFKEHYNCNVHLVGKSHDGGKDLILVESDKSIIVQVKRRTIAKKTESVKEVRDLLGATLLSDSTSCIFVTTADHFSKDAINARNMAIEKSIVAAFDLYDFHRFANLLNIYNQNKQRKWKEFITIIDTQEEGMD